MLPAVEQSHALYRWVQEKEKRKALPISGSHTWERRNYHNGNELATQDKDQQDSRD
jgi:hypothetical protein